MLIIELTYTQPIEKIDAQLQAHRQFIEGQVALGHIIAAGPKVPRTGGMIIANLPLDAAKELIKSDPFYQHDLAEYHFTEFSVVSLAPALVEVVR